MQFFQQTNKELVMLLLLVNLFINSADAGVLGKYSFAPSTSCGGDYLEFEQGTMELVQGYSSQYKVRLVYTDGQDCLDIYNMDISKYMGIMCPLIANGDQLIFRMELIGQGSDIYKTYKCY
jgi:hypothetical protein